MKQLHVCVIGAGIAGLAAVKNAIGSGMEVTVFEQAKKLGGTWVYTDEVGKDEYGMDVHTAMYKGLMTNLPKELMGYPDFPIPGQEKSYIPAQDVLSFLELYARNFGLLEKIKFSHHVLRVRPYFEGNQWEVIVKDLPNNRYETLFFDAVIVCNGHYNTPLYPDIPGRELFRGQQFHSRDFRCADPFKNETVLVIGGGPSGVDVAGEMTKYAKRVTLSHHLNDDPHGIFEGKTNLTFKPDVVKMSEKKVTYSDGTSEEFSVIFYCTGYKYAFPFLSVDCEIQSEDSYIRPLYKHIININYPTMAFIGIPTSVCATQMFDLQVRFFLKFLSGQKQMPSKKEMEEDTDREMAERWARGYTKRHAHLMGSGQMNYYDDLARTADIEPIKPVITKIHRESTGKYLHKNFRNDRFVIIDDETFTKIKG